VIWITADGDDYFQTSEITDVLRLAERVGIVAWTLDSGDPTSTFTHPGVAEFSVHLMIMKYGQSITEQ